MKRSSPANPAPGAYVNEPSGARARAPWAGPEARDATETPATRSSSLPSTPGAGTVSVPDSSTPYASSRAVGDGYRTVTTSVCVAVAPRASVTVSVTVYSPGVA